MLPWRLCFCVVKQREKFLLLNNQQETTKLYSTITPAAISKAADSGNSCSSRVTTGAGVGSPETKRKNTQMLDTNWIVGFFEGDGCITSTMTSYGPDLSFIVRQADPEILYRLQQRSVWVWFCF